MSPSPESLIGSHIDGPPSQETRHGDTDVHKSASDVTGHAPYARSYLQSTASDELHDLVCVGFGPASLAIAVALHDAIEDGDLARPPRVLFLEKQLQFAWHAGMLLPGAKMQISFLKDLATLRNPRSHFTFLNFVHQQGRLIDFINLDTFLPARAEYEDYLSWAADHFRDVVRYGRQTLSVAPVTPADESAISEFMVTTQDVQSGDVTTVRAKHVVLAIGGQGHIPECLPSNHPRIIHSSQYAHLVPKILDHRDAPYRVAVIGAGQSAAEIFNNIQTLYANSSTYLIMRTEFLKPSDDSPFVNSIFNPSFVDELFSRPVAQRDALIADAKATNYAVVRLKLIEQLYERMYDQKRRLGPDERDWPHRILAATEIMGLDSSDASQHELRLRTRSLLNDAEEILGVDLVIAATGYHRTHHLQMMADIQSLLPGGEVAVQRDYSVRFAPGKVAPGSGIWLQGCNEQTHGLSDTLLSVLATRSAEIVRSIFGKQEKQQNGVKTSK